MMLVLSSISALGEVYTDRNTVKRVQQALNDAGYNCGTPDGIAGQKTHSAVESFCRDNGLPVSNSIDDALLQKLGVVIYKQINFADYGITAQLPAEVAENLGGFPNSIDALEEMYSVSYMKKIFPLWSADIRNLKYSLGKAGTAIVPESLMPFEDAHFWCYDSDYGYIYDQEVTLRKEGNQLVATIGEGHPYDDSNIYYLTMHYNDKNRKFSMESSGKSDDPYDVCSCEISYSSSRQLRGTWTQSVHISEGRCVVNIDHFLNPGIEYWYGDYDESGNFGDKLNYENH